MYEGLGSKGSKEPIFDKSEDCYTKANLISEFVQTKIRLFHIKQKNNNRTYKVLPNPFSTTRDGNDMVHC